MQLVAGQILTPRNGWRDGFGGQPAFLAGYTGYGERRNEVTATIKLLGGEQPVELATFGAGCFWGVEEEFRQIPGVLDTKVGYMGGSLENPTYRDVCTDRTGHAEVVQVSFDPAKVSYGQLLDTFWHGHDPTTLNRQGPDVGRQYRSVIFFHSPAQEAEARQSLDALQQSGRFRRPVVTSIEPAQKFYVAEDYHQRYLQKQGLGSCHI